MKSIRSYLPSPLQVKQRDKRVTIQARISPELKEQVKRIAKKNNWKPSEVIRASLQKFIDDEILKAI